MSEQNQSNFQALGAGLLGFVAVMAVGGGALMVHSSQQSKAAAKPVAAAAPIDIGAASPASLPEMSASRARQEERRMESPAPLIGENKTESIPSSAPLAARARAAGASSEASAAPALEVTGHLDAAPGDSSAQAVVKNTIEPEKPAVKAAEKKKSLPKADTSGTGAGSEAVASVHYGVTSRSELMGRAAGPVYNIAGAGKKGGTAATGKLAGETKATLTDLQRQLEASGLPEDQRAKLKKELEDATKGLAEDVEKPAQ